MLCVVEEIEWEVFLNSSVLHFFNNTNQQQARECYKFILFAGRRVSTAHMQNFFLIMRSFDNYANLHALKSCVCIFTARLICIFSLQFSREMSSTVPRSPQSTGLKHHYDAHIESSLENQFTFFESSSKQVFKALNFAKNLMAVHSGEQLRKKTYYSSKYSSAVGMETNEKNSVNQQKSQEQESERKLLGVVGRARDIQWENISNIKKK